MRKLYLLSDEWINDRIFIGKELDIIRKYYDVTVICNVPDIEDKESVFPEGIHFSFYRRPHWIFCILPALVFFFDRDAWKEIRNVIKQKNAFSKVQEVFRFYVNASLFYNYLKQNHFIGNNTNDVYYSYWFFWKCYAVTKHKSDNPNIKIITRTHEYDLYHTSLASGYQPFKNEMEHNLDYIVFISDYGREYYLNHYGNESVDKCLLYYLGTENPYKIHEYKKHDKFVIVSCSSLIIRKRVDIIIDAISLLDSIEIEWIHFGSGEMEAELIQMAHDKLDSLPNITYEFAGYTSNTEILEFYSKNDIDVFITTTSSEGNPVSVMEAMSFGIPIIATDVCNFSHMIDGNGILVPSNSNGEIVSNAIRELNAMRTEDILQMRQQSRRLWEENYRADVNNQKFVEEIVCVV